MLAFTQNDDFRSGEAIYFCWHDGEGTLPASSSAQPALPLRARSE
jgi:hypothetical protein